MKLAIIIILLIAVVYLVYKVYQKGKSLEEEESLSTSLRERLAESVEKTRELNTSIDRAKQDLKNSREEAEHWKKKFNSKNPPNVVALKPIKLDVIEDPDVLFQERLTKDNPPVTDATVYVKLSKGKLKEAYINRKVKGTKGTSKVPVTILSKR